MALGDFLARLGGGGNAAPEPPPTPTPAAPNRDDLGAALDRVEAMVTDGAVPSCVTARVERVTHVVRDMIPRLGAIKGSANAYSVMATATDYLPEALGGYLRLPRRFADSRPVDAGRTSLMVLVDQLDLLGATMDQVFDAVCRDDATALVAHGRFLEEKFGHSSTGGQLDVGTSYAVPPPPVMSTAPAPAPAPEADVPAPETDVPAPETANQDPHATSNPQPAGEPPTPSSPDSAPPPLPPPTRSMLDLDAAPPGTDEPARLTPPSWP